MSARVSSYYRLAKPGIIYGNSIALLTGYLYFIASGGELHLLGLLYAIIGTAFIIGSACVANNIIDKDIDVYMKRTAKRALVTGEISVFYAVLYSVVLLVIGSILLYQTNITALGLALSGWVLYVLPYTYLKRITYHATLVGTLPGAIPPLVGYYAAGGNSLQIAVILLAVMVAWQMTHFYAIAIFRKDEYALASVPVISIVKGLSKTIQHMQIWAFVCATTLVLSAFYANVAYASGVVLLAGWWIRSSIYNAGDDISWSRQVFFASLLFLLVWLGITTISALISLATNI